MLQPPPKARRCVLVVDDDPFMRMIIRNSLQGDIEVAEAASGEAALACLQSLMPDLVLLDVVMPGWDGFETCAALRAHPDWGQRPIIMLTSGADTASIERAHAAGATDFMTKPVHTALLHYRVRYLLRAHDTSLTLQNRERQLGAVQRSARLGHWEYWPEARHFVLSTTARGLFGLADTDAPRAPHDLLALIHPTDQDSIRELFSRLDQAPGAPLQFEHRLATGGLILAQTAEYHAGKHAHWLGTVQDVTDLRRAARRVVRLAYYDSKTRLPNRAFFVEYLQRLLDADPRREQWVLALEVDALRRVGVGWGEAVTEPLLRDLVARLSAELAFVPPRPPLLAPQDWHLHQGPLLARLSDSAFAMLSASNASDSLALAERLVALLQTPLTVAGVDLVIAGRVGLAQAPRHGREADTLARRAQAAAMQEYSGTRIHVYEPRVDNRQRHRLTLEARLRQAIDHGQLELWYQPKLDARDGTLAGAEALVRWRDPRDGLVAPGRFIPLAEDGGLIVPLTEWVLDRACADLRILMSHGWGDLRLAVNISAAQLDHQPLAEEIARRLTRAGVAPASLELEITERALMPRAASVLDNLNALHELGVAIALDDFGTGYSSLGYLGRFPLDTLKIDQSFIQELGQGSSGEAVVRAIIALAEGLRFEVVAEGIETLDQAHWLLAEGCHLHQGYLYARPQEFETFTRDFIVDDGAPNKPLPTPVAQLQLC
ncbi:Bacteriophytochrome cph2 [Thiorhodovibrio winogradskyi]|uniref:Bacteriophytochrome cph2 n=1 Tax=Thiorhodovibrio winogradskyi TaxID=77007 RepID=A0ABZ0S9U2_9GAMM|nr:EAL domain-containing protein [Thiorhodovibrio winogradskyi]